MQSTADRIGVSQTTFRRAVLAGGVFLTLLVGLLPTPSLEVRILRVASVGLATSALLQIRALRQNQRDARAFAEKLSSRDRMETGVVDAILENMVDGVMVASTDGKLSMFNRAASSLMGIDSAGVPIQSWPDEYGMYRANKKTPYLPDDVPIARGLRGETVIQEDVYIENSRV
ncbi:MAG: PAS domain-containing protein, partial [Planctomycetota bacterium]